MKKIIVTIGPGSIEPRVLHALVRAGASSLRINLSHSNRNELGKYFSIIESVGIVPSIDTQGAQLRVQSLPDITSFTKGDRVNLYFGEYEDSQCVRFIKNDDPKIILNHPEVADQVFVGDVLKVDFNGLLLSLETRVSESVWCAKVLASGKVVNNRAVDIIGRSVQLAVLTEFDVEAIQYAQSRGCREVYASFISSHDDVLRVRSTLNNETLLVSKIESAVGVANAADIIAASDAVLIDRGDLSREISIPSVPIAVNSIIQLARDNGTPVYVATNILDSMMCAPIPSRAEISDIYTLLKSGVSGLVLAAEVAIGNNPIASTALIEYLMRLYDCHEKGLFGVGLVQKPDKQLIGDQLYSWI